MLMNRTNQTEDDFSCYHPSVVSYRYFTVVLGCAVIIIGTVGNLMTILAFALQPQLKTRFNVLIVYLALVDLLYCIMLHPFSVDAYLHLRWRTGELWCSIYSLLFFVFNSVSIITLCLIAGARYLMVTKRAMFDRVFSDFGLPLLIISEWVLGLVTIAPLWRGNRFEKRMCICNIDQRMYHPYPIILLCFFFFGGMVCVGTFYLLIYIRVRRSSQALLRHRFNHRHSRKKPASPARDTNDSGIESSVANTCGCETSSQGEPAKKTDEINSETSSQSTLSSATAQSATECPSDVITTSPSPTSALASSPCSKASGEDEHVAGMCLAVLLGFVFCFIPFSLIMLLELVDKHYHPRVLLMFCLNISWLSSCVNPVLYAAMNRQFRQAYSVLLTRAAAPFTCLWPL
ncbi:G-protein coupled receptor 84-like [Pagrus major]|uniref:G-protein coupled receptor 84-like n=1 Tax=Pagrus major TaxID=143350 RepID=UPI003CC8D8BB